MEDTHLSAQQSQVIDALSSGANLTQAAAQAGVHRNAVANWRSSSPQFRQALAGVQSDRELLFRERAEELAGLAFDSLGEVLKDPKASPSVRLRAAMFIIRTAMPSAPSKARKLPTFNNAPPEQPQKEPPVAQERTTENLHKNAQKPQPYRRPEPKVGRNQACPCGSGRKYKRCCLGKSQTAAA
ncbi:MAG: SEC-C metal-binding domain-containing protein [Bryobacteraceae bacterium]|jgi:hypothetical protein